MRLILACAIFLLINCSSVYSATYFIRNGGGTGTQCTGLADADYDGSGSGEACAFNDLQIGLDIVTFGDTIKLKAGQTFSTPDNAFSEWALTNKGTPPTNTDSDYIIITTTDSSGTPTALFTYPQVRTRITDAMAVNMPHIIGNGSTPTFRVKNGAKYWRIRGLEITNDSTNGWQTKYFISDDDPISSAAAVSHHIQILENWIHPDEEDGTILTTSNINRSAENAIQLNTVNSLIKNNAIQGFVGKVRYGGEAGLRITSSAVLVGVYAENLLVENNLLEAWTYAIFFGGSSMPDWTVTNGVGGATVVSCSSSTVCTLTNVNNLSINQPISGFVSGASPPTWGASFVQGISGNQVTLTAPLCHSYDGGNTCVTVTGTATPSAGDAFRWNGLLPNNIIARRNLFAHYDEWAALLDGDCGGKGYGEIKACKDCTIEANIFTKCTGITITIRNQAGDFPWVSLSGLKFKHNVFEESNRIFTSYYRDTTPTAKSQDILWYNNLILGVTGNVSAGIAGGEFSANSGGAINLVFDHNTIAWNKTHTTGLTLSAWKNFVNFETIGSYDNKMEGLVFKNNIVPIGQNSCFDSGVITNCWQSATVNTNVFVNVDGYTTGELNSWWLTAYPSNTLITSYSTVQFVNPSSDLGAGSGRDYTLASGSPYKNAATDGKDIGYINSEMTTVLGFDYLTGGQAPSHKKCNWHANPRCNQ